MNPAILPVANAVRHSIMRTISVLCVLAVIATIVYSVWRVFNPKPRESYAQVVQAGGNNYNIEIYNPEDTFFLGVKFWGLKFGLSKPTVKKIKEITEETKK